MDDVELEPLDDAAPPATRRTHRRVSFSPAVRVLLVVAAVVAAFAIGRTSADRSSHPSQTPPSAQPTTNAAVARTEPSSTTTTSSVVPGVAGVFAGTWQHHSMAFGIDPAGHGLILFRTYADCATDPPPCDVIAGSGIYSGGLTTFTITANGNDAVGQITSSTDPNAFPLGRSRHATTPTKTF